MRYLLPLFIVFFTGCSLKNYEHTSSKVITIKTPKLRFSDLGYVKNSNKAVGLELFVAGKLIKKIDINYLICVDEGCMSKSSFNAEYLEASYPDDLLQDIILGLPIYDAKNLQKSDGGFKQLIVNDSVNIEYRVDAREIYFKDKKNHILFKIKDIK